MKEVKKLTGNNLLTIRKDLLCYSKYVPEILTKEQFTNYYYFMYCVKMSSKRVIEINFTKTYMLGCKIITTPKIIKKSINFINLHIPQSIVNQFREKYFEMKIINPTTIHLIGLTENEYNKLIK